MPRDLERVAAGLVMDYAYAAVFVGDHFLFKSL
jgi:hypothetical protein